MKKIIFSALFGLPLVSLPAHAFNFKVICAGGESYGDNSDINPKSGANLANSLNDQLAALAKTQKILDVSSPMVGSGSATATNGQYWGSAFNSLVCVTVKLQ